MMSFLYFAFVLSLTHFYKKIINYEKSIYYRCLLINRFILAGNRTKDETAINMQVDAMIQTRNNHNYDDLKNYATENTDWVDVVGMSWKGRKESQYAHQSIIIHFLNGRYQRKSLLPFGL